MNSVPDPRDTLDDSYRRQLDLLITLRRGVADVAASRDDVELQMSALRERERGGRRSGRQRDDLDSELSSLAERRDLLQAEEEKLKAAAGRLELKLGTFRIRKEVINASFALAEAKARVGDLWSCAADEMDVTGIPSWRRHEILERLWRAISSMAAARDYFNREVGALRQRYTELEDHARRALSAGQEDVTREVLAHRAEVGSQLSELVAECRSAQLEEEKIVTAYQQLTARVRAAQAQF